MSKPSVVGRTLQWLALRRMMGIHTVHGSMMLGHQSTDAGGVGVGVDDDDDNDGDNVIMVTDHDAVAEHDHSSTSVDMSSFIKYFREIQHTFECLGWGRHSVTLGSKTHNVAIKFECDYLVEFARYFESPHTKVLRPVHFNKLPLPKALRRSTFPTVISEQERNMLAAFREHAVMGVPHLRSYSSNDRYGAVLCMDYCGKRTLHDLLSNVWSQYPESRESLEQASLFGKHLNYIFKGVAAQILGALVQMSVRVPGARHNDPHIWNIVVGDEPEPRILRMVLGSECTLRVNLAKVPRASIVDWGQSHALTRELRNSALHMSQRWLCPNADAIMFLTSVASMFETLAAYEHHGLCGLPFRSLASAFDGLATKLAGAPLDVSFRASSQQRAVMWTMDASHRKDVNRAIREKRATLLPDLLKRDPFFAAFRVSAGDAALVQTQPQTATQTATATQTESHVLWANDTERRQLEETEPDSTDDPVWTRDRVEDWLLEHQFH